VAALAKGQELFTYLSLAKKNIIPKPIFTMFNGGRYADTNLDFQELMLVPVAEKKCSENVAMGAAIFEQLGEILKQAGYDTDTGTIGAYAPDIDSTIQALELILASAIRSGYNPGEEIALGIDVGSSLLFDPITKRYIFSLDQAYFSAQTLSSLYREWLSKFPLVLLEDPFVATEKDSWRSLTAELGKEMLIAGDDLFAGDIKKFKAAKEENLVNTLVLKPDQCLTVTGALSLAALAKKQGYKIIVSERNGETNDDFIADFAVAISADYLKAGALRRGERLAKYNRLMEIENQLYGKK
jgi:enolase